MPHCVPPPGGDCVGSGGSAALEGWHMAVGQ